MKIELKKEKKKAAIVNLTLRIGLGDAHLGLLELRYIREYLQFFDREVDYVSRKTKKEY